MIAKFQQGWLLFKASIAVTLRNRQLLWFPVMSTFLTALIALFFLAPLALPVILHPTGYHLNQKEHWIALKDHYLPPEAVKPTARPAPTPADALNNLAGGRPATNPVKTFAQSPLISLYLVGIYFGSMFLATFFNVAFYSEIMVALNGREVSLRRGLKLALSRWRAILAWTLLAGIVGWIIQQIQERLPLVGRIVTGLIGLAWSVAAVFVIPVIIREESIRNPIKILRQSAVTLTRTWGEGVIGYLGFSGASTVIFLCSLLPLLLAGGVALMFHSVWVMLLGVALWMGALFCLAYVSSVASNVYRCALYIYAAEGVVPDPYDRQLLDSAWKVKPTS